MNIWQFLDRDALIQYIAVSATILTLLRGSSIGHDVTYIQLLYHCHYEIQCFQSHQAAVFGASVISDFSTVRYIQ